MVDYSANIVAALQTILPVYHELVLNTDTETPCISYQERNNAVNVSGDTIGYSTVSYTVKVWGYDIAELFDYAKQIDNVLRPFGFKRISSGELYDINSTMIQKILTYEATCFEEF